MAGGKNLKMRMGPMLQEKSNRRQHRSLGEDDPNSPGDRFLKQKGG